MGGGALYCAIYWQKDEQQSKTASRLHCTVRLELPGLFIRFPPSKEEADPIGSRCEAAGRPERRTIAPDIGRCSATVPLQSFSRLRQGRTELNLSHKRVRGTNICSVVGAGSRKRRVNLKPFIICPFLEELQNNNSSSSSRRRTPL